MVIRKKTEKHLDDYSIKPKTDRLKNLWTSVFGEFSNNYRPHIKYIEMIIGTEEAYQYFLFVRENIEYVKTIFPDTEFTPQKLKNKEIISLYNNHKENEKKTIVKDKKNIEKPEGKKSGLSENINGTTVNFSKLNKEEIDKARKICELTIL